MPPPPKGPPPPSTVLDAFFGKATKVMAELPLSSSSSALPDRVLVMDRHLLEVAIEAFSVHTDLMSLVRGLEEDKKKARSELHSEKAKRAETLSSLSVVEGERFKLCKSLDGAASEVRALKPRVEELERELALAKEEVGSSMGKMRMMQEKHQPELAAKDEEIARLNAGDGLDYEIVVQSVHFKEVYDALAGQAREMVLKELEEADRKKQLEGLVDQVTNQTPPRRDEEGSKDEGLKKPNPNSRGAAAP